MGLLSLEIIGFFTALIFLLEFGLRHEKADLLGIFEESLLLSLIPLGVLAYILDPQITTGVIIVSAYTPHAYNLIIWPSLSLLVLRKKFGSRLLIPALMFLYGLDEILWNVIAYLRFFGNTTGVTVPLVLVLTEGSSSRTLLGNEMAPVYAVIVGVIDEVDVR